MSAAKNMLPEPKEVISSPMEDFFPETALIPEDFPDERYTPRALFQVFDREFCFTLDVCATAESAKCNRYFTKEQDGLKQSWRGERVWCNPPFSNIEPWVVRASEMRAQVSVLLVPSVRTEQQWWQKWVEPFRDKRGPHRVESRFLPGRIRFGFPGNPEGVGVGSPPFGCVLLIWSSPP